MRKLITILSLTALLWGILPAQAMPAAAQNEINAAPVANDDSGPGFITDEDSPFTLADVLANDSDPEGDPLIIASFDTSGMMGVATFTGSLDPGFGDYGWLTTDFFGDNDGAFALVLQPGGKLIAAGYAYNDSNSYDFALARYNPNGSLDTSFDGDGMLTTDFFSGFDNIYALALQPDGKIVVASK